MRHYQPHPNLVLFQENHMNTACCHHPEREALQLCDHCDRFLCRDCLGETINRPGRTYYYCFDEACDGAYRKMIKREIWPTLLFLLLVPIFSVPFAWAS